MPRPKGSKDKVKRKRKVILCGTKERELVDDYENGMSTNLLIKKYDVTKSYINTMFKNRNIKRRINLSIIDNWEKIDNINFLDKNICGIYAIYFKWKYDKNNSNAHFKVNDIQMYIGSSVDIKSRLQSHCRELKNTSHYSSTLKNYFNDGKYNMQFAIIERCSVKDVLQRESYHLNRYSSSCILNSWRHQQKKRICGPGWNWL